MKAKKIVDAHFDKLPFHGLGKDHSSNWWKALAYQLISHGYLMETIRDIYKFVSVSPKGEQYLRSAKPNHQPPLILPLTDEMVDDEEQHSTMSGRRVEWREVKRFVDLTADETCDLWLTAKKVGFQLESFHKATSLAFTIQDGPQSGQTVPHVHIHILRRKVGDFEKNDEIYDAIDEKEKKLKEKLDLDKERIDRSAEEMAEEADAYRALFL